MRITTKSGLNLFEGEKTVGATRIELHHSLIAKPLLILSFYLSLFLYHTFVYICMLNRMHGMRWNWSNVGAGHVGLGWHLITALLCS